MLERAPHKFYEDAAAAIQVAEDSGFQNLAALKRAHQSLEKAVALDPQDTRYLFLMAYLWFLMGSAEVSQAYLKAVLTLEPEHAQALELRRTWAQQQNLPPLAAWQQQVQAFEALPVPRNEAEYDFLYAEIEQFLQSMTRYFMQLELSPQSTMDSQTVAAQEQVLQQLNHVQQLVDQKLQLLAQKLEIQPLTQLNHPLRQIHARFEEALWATQVFNILQTACDAVQADAVNLLKEVKAAGENGRRPGDHFQSALNDLLDACDALADDLDAISERSSIDAIVPHYEETLRYVQHVQDVLDQTL